MWKYGNVGNVKVQNYFNDDVVHSLDLFSSTVPFYRKGIRRLG